jgi:hypothetical protein
MAWNKPLQFSSPFRLIWKRLLAGVKPPLSISMMLLSGVYNAVMPSPTKSPASLWR